MNGTSFAAPQVAGAVAALLEKNPQLTPDQVKWTLTQSGRSLSASAPALDLAAALLLAGPIGNANVGLVPSTGPVLAVSTTVDLTSKDVRDAASFEKSAAELENQRAFDKAGDSWRKAADKWQTAKVLRNAAIAYHNSAADWMAAGKWDRVQDIEQRAAQAWETFGSRPGAGIASELGADSARRRGDLAGAASLFERAATNWELAGESTARAPRGAAPPTSGS